VISLYREQTSHRLAIKDKAKLKACDA
jgi:hypothetical protein